MYLSLELPTIVVPHKSFIGGILNCNLTSIERLL
jgi:hypothetical protein